VSTQLIAAQFKRRPTFKHNYLPSRVRRARRWCEIKLRVPYPAMKPSANAGVRNSTSWNTKAPIAWKVKCRAAVRRKCDKSLDEFRRYIGTLS